MMNLLPRVPFLTTSDPPEPPAPASDDGADHPATTENQPPDLPSTSFTRMAVDHILPKMPLPMSYLVNVPGTLLPAPWAQLISALAMGSRISMRSVAFILEAMLESSKYSTQVSMGITRRMLITAVTAARSSYLLTQGNSTISESADHNKFLTVLDHYTNLGLYLIHTTFSLTELFTLSSLSLLSTSISHTHTAFSASVDLFDGLFGSTETSRTLAAIIGLVREELIADKEWEGRVGVGSGVKGRVRGWAMLTKAMCAYAVLQRGCRERSEVGWRMRTLYDCTVISGEQTRKQTSGTSSSTNSTSTIHPSNPSISAIALPQPNLHRRSISLTPSHIPFPTHPSRPTSPTSSESESDLPPDSATMIRRLDALIGEPGDEPLPAGAEERKRRRRRRVVEIEEEVEEIRSETIRRTTLRRMDVPVGGAVFGRAGGKGAVGPPVRRGSGGGFEVDSPEVEVEVEQTVVPASGEEDDWIEVDQLLSSQLPSNPNGAGSVAYRSALAESPGEGGRRFEVILRSMTMKVLRKKVVRRTVTTGGDFDDEETVRGVGEPKIEELREGLRKGRRDVRELDWRPPGTSVTENERDIGEGSSQYPTSSPSRSFDDGKLPGKGKGKVLNKLKNAFSSHKGMGKRRISDGPEESRKSLRMERSSNQSDEGMMTRSSSPTTPPPPPKPKPNHPPHFRFPASPSRSIIPPPAVGKSTQAISTSASFAHALSAEADPGNLDGLWPPVHLVTNLHRFCRYSSAAYGQNFLKLLNMGDTDFDFPSTSKHHANVYSFAQHTNLSIEDVLLGGYTSAPVTAHKAPPLIHYVTVDSAAQSIVLTCRGTLGLNDVLTDLTCRYQQVPPKYLQAAPRDGDYKAHEGMWFAAEQLLQHDATVMETLRRALQQYSDFGLVITGHSLGGGVASLLAIALSCPTPYLRAKSPGLITGPTSTSFVTSDICGLPAGRPVHCYAYGPPATASLDLISYSKGLITSCVHGHDVVPSLSLGVLRDFKGTAIAFHEEPGNVPEEIIGRAIGIFQRDSAGINRATNLSLSPTTSEEPKQELSVDQLSGDITSRPAFQDRATIRESSKTTTTTEKDHMWSLITTLRAGMDQEKLYPAGRVYVIDSYPIFLTGMESRSLSHERQTSRRDAHRARLREVGNVEARFGEPLFDRSMLNDHLPSNYELNTKLLYDGLGLQA